MSRVRVRILMMGILVAGLGYLATGLIIVAPGETAVVRRLGRVLPRPFGPGLHLGWPVGFDRVIRVRTDEVRRLRVGLAGTPGPDDQPGAGEYLTGDLNLIRAEASVQYKVADPVAFVLRARDLDPLLTRAAEASLSRALARRGIDASLREGRAGVVRDVEDELERISRDDRLGLAVLGVSLTDARPPAEVAADFALAQSASSEHDRRVNEARTIASTTLTNAGATANARLERARARADRTLTIARGRAGRFRALLAEADKARGLTVRRLYLETTREILARVRRKLVLPDEPLDLSLFGVGGPGERSK